MTNEDMLLIARARVALLEGRVQRDVYDAYTTQVHKPNVPMELSIEDYAAWWGEGDRWARRGREDGSLQMRRIDRTLPLQVGNIKEHRLVYREKAPVRPVVSPSGVTYATTAEAAAAISVDARSIAALAKAGRLGWKYADAE